MDFVFYEKAAELQKRHWWFLGRKNIIRSFLNKLALPQNAKLLDIGTVTGGSLEMLSEFGEVEGLEPEQAAIDFYKGPFTIHRGALPNDHTLSSNHYDVCTLLDVLEHIDNDVQALQSSLSMLKANGFCIITVPAMPSLWTKHDEALHHKRRYTKKSLLELLDAQNNITIEKISYFNFYFLLPAIVVRLLEKCGLTIESSSHKTPPAFINALMTSVFSSEKLFLKFFGFPIGLSLIAIVKKSAEENIHVE